MNVYLSVNYFSELETEKSDLYKTGLILKELIFLKMKSDLTFSRI